MAPWTRKRRAGAVETGVHPVDEVLPPGPMVAYGLQHVLSMYAGVVAVPIIVGTALGAGLGILVARHLDEPDRVGADVHDSEVRVPIAPRLASAPSSGSAARRGSRSRATAIAAPAIE